MRSKRRTVMFSLIFCTSACRVSSTVLPPSVRAERAATSLGPALATSCARELANAANSGLRATKSVSEFTSTIAPSLPSGERHAPIAPSAATREAALLALAPLLMRSSSSAFLMSPCASSNAFLHSIMPSPVRSRNSLTMPAVISAIAFLPVRHPREGGDPVAKKGLLAPFVQDHSREPSDWPPSCLRRVLDLDEVVGRRGDHLVDHLAAALEDRVRHAAGVEADGARRVVVAGDHVVDSVERVVRVDDADDGNAERLGLGHRDLVEAHVDHEERVRDAAHVLDAAQRALELLLLAREVELLLLGEALDRVVGGHLVHLLQALDGSLDRLEVGEHAAQPAIVDIRGAGALRLFLHDFTGLALGADEEDLALVRGELAHVLERVLVHRKRLLEIDDVD